MQGKPPSANYLDTVMEPLSMVGIPLCGKLSIGAEWRCRARYAAALVGSACRAVAAITATMRASQDGTISMLAEVQIHSCKLCYNRRIRNRSSHGRLKQTYQQSTLRGQAGAMLASKWTMA